MEGYERGKRWEKYYPDGTKLTAKYFRKYKHLAQIENITKL